MAKKNTTTTEPAADPSAALVTVEVINQPIFEDNARREKGDRFQVTARRADAIRHFVRVVEDTPSES